MSDYIIKVENLVKRFSGLVFQDPSLDEQLSGLQNLRSYALVYDISASVREKRIEEMLAMVELWDKRHSEVRTCSGGMKRRLELALSPDNSGLSGPFLIPHNHYTAY